MYGGPINLTGGPPFQFRQIEEVDVIFTKSISMKPVLLAGAIIGVRSLAFLYSISAVWL